MHKVAFAFRSLATCRPPTAPKRLLSAKDRQRERRMQFSKATQTAATSKAKLDSSDLSLKVITETTRVDAGLGVRGGDSMIQDRLGKMKEEGRACLTEREITKTEGATFVSAMNTYTMIARAAAELKASGKPLPMGLYVDERVPPFHTEFSARGRWPAACDVLACQERLTRAFKDSQLVNVHLSGWMMKRDSVTASDLFKRLCTNDPSVIDWYSRAKYGSVNLTNEGIYDPRQLHTYSNAVNRKEMMTRGTCSVSIGFVDLAFLREAEFDPSYDGTGVTRWVGYEASPYCVAKSIVIATMLLQRAPVDAVLQVWYSAPI